MTSEPQKPADDNLQPALPRVGKPGFVQPSGSSLQQLGDQLRLLFRQAPATGVLLALNIAIFIIPTLLQLVNVQIDGIPVNDYVLGFGVLYGPFVKEYGQYYRFLTSMFLHYGLLHIAFNSYSLYIFGVQIEQLYGTWRFGAIYLISGLCGGAAYYALSTGAGAGASGAIFGLIGALLIFTYMYRQRFRDNGRQLLGFLLTLSAINLAYGFNTPNIGTTAHIGGLVGGVVLGWLLAPRYALDQRSQPPQLVRRQFPWGWAATIGLLALLVCMIILIKPPIQ